MVKILKEMGSCLCGWVDGWEGTSTLLIVGKAEVVESSHSALC